MPLPHDWTMCTVRAPMVDVMRPPEPTGTEADDHARRLARLRWRARRGLLENDLLIERFFERHGASLSVAQIGGFEELLQLSDPDLLELLLGRRSAEPTEFSTAAREVLAQLRMS